MSILKCYERNRSRSGRFGEKGETRYRRLFFVQTNDADDGPLLAATAVDPQTGVKIPSIGDIYTAGNEVDVSARVVGIDPQQTDDYDRAWEVAVEYSSAANAQQQSNPFARPTDITYSSQKFTRPLWFDINGVACTNSAGTIFDPPVEMDDSRPIVTMTRNEPSFNPAIADFYQDAVNSDPFWGYPARSVKIAGISAQSVSENGLNYVRVTYQFEIRRDLWIPLKVQDVGLKDKNNAELAGNLPVTIPWPLDGNGLFVAPPITAASVNVKEFTVYKEVSFFPLMLP